jgi:hypothetical protein
LGRDENPRDPNQANTVDAQVVSRKYPLKISLIEHQFGSTLIKTKKSHFVVLNFISLIQKIKVCVHLVISAGINRAWIRYQIYGIVRKQPYAPRATREKTI